ncbi:general secretion pathway protein H [methanotrophic bacterial endosymbiont of Bathymodiolus sp.]|nr:general secretion pathway protein H [methanotrophic bacterial endosymbiont of Bathymodiolus sp.]
MGIINKFYRSSADFSPLLDGSQGSRLKHALHVRGFTLIELLLVIVIIAMAAAVVAPNIGSGNQTANLNAAAREMSSALRFARGHALTHRKETVVMVNLEDNSYQITDRSKKYKVAKDIAISLDVAQSQIIDQEHGGVRFFPDGSSTGGRITLELGDNKRQIDINWLTGQTEIDDY